MFLNFLCHIFVLLWEEKESILLKKNERKPQERGKNNTMRLQGNMRGKGKENTISKKRDKLKGYSTEYKKTKHGRANSLVRDYRRADNAAGRGECTLTAEWIEENIFTSVCHYCGESDWTKLGADRKDSSLPHTPDNCVPCCLECNNKRGTTPYDDFMRLIKKVG